MYSRFRFFITFDEKCKFANARALGWFVAKGRRMVALTLIHREPGYTTKPPDASKEGGSLEDEVHL